MGLRAEEIYVPASTKGASSPAHAVTKWDIRVDSAPQGNEQMLGVDDWGFKKDNSAVTAFKKFVTKPAPPPTKKEKALMKRAAAQAKKDAEEGMKKNCPGPKCKAAKQAEKRMKATEKKKVEMAKQKNDKGMLEKKAKRAKLVAEKKKAF